MNMDSKYLCKGIVGNQRLKSHIQAWGMPVYKFKSALHLWDSRNVEVEALSAPGVLLPDQRLAPTNRLELDTAGKTRWQGRPLAVPPATSQH